MIDATRAIEVAQAVASRLSGLGWERLEPNARHPANRNATCLPSTGALAAAAWILPTVPKAAGQPEAGVVALVGCDCPVAREVTTALLGRAYSGAVLKQPRLSIALEDHGSNGVAAAATTLVDFVLEHEQAVGGTNVDDLLALLRDGSAVTATSPSAALEQASTSTSSVPQRESAEVAAAILAAIGRREEAHAILASLSASTDPEHRSEIRFLRQLERWLASNGTLALPTSPAQWGPSLPEDRGKARAWSEHREKGIATREAIDAVRAISRGKDRAELRSLLQHELAARGIGLGPDAIEARVDSLLERQTALGRARATVRGLQGIARFLGDSRADRGPLATILDDESDPPTEKRHSADFPLPERATYPVTGGQEPTIVGIDSSATRSVKEALHDRRAAHVRIWLTAEDASGTVGVHLGEQRIAILTGGQAARFTPAIAAAAEREELPWTHAQLTGGREPKLQLFWPAS